MSSRELPPTDGVDWPNLPEWMIHSGRQRYLVKVTNLQSPTYEYLLYSDEYLQLYGHYTIVKDKLVGYSLDFTNHRKHRYIERPWYVGIFTDWTIPNQNPQQLYVDKNVRLYKFNGGESSNYAFAIRWRVDKEVELTV